MPIAVYPLYRAIKYTVDITQQFQQRTVRIIRVVETKKCHRFVQPLMLFEVEVGAISESIVSKNNSGSKRPESPSRPLLALHGF